MSSEVSSTYSDIRIGGLVSGLDTDSIVESLMKIENQKLVKIEKDKIYASWEAAAYREITDTLSEFSKNQFSLTNSENNILATSDLKTVNIYDNSDYASIIANGDAIVDNYSINEIVQLAKSSQTSSSSQIKGSIQSSNDITTSPTLDVDGMSFFIRLDGVQEEISFSENFTTADELVTDLNNQLNSLFGTDRVLASLEGGTNLSFASDNSTIQIISDTASSGTVEYLGFNAGDMNTLNVRSSLENQFGADEDISFTINEVDFTFTKEDSIFYIMDEINESSAKVKMTYSGIDDKISITSTKTGAGAEVSITNTTGDLFGTNSFINISEGVTRNGQDAKFYLNDANKTSVIQRSSNVFTIDNITYSLKKETTEALDFSINDNIDDSLEKIKSFVQDYNDILDVLNNKINETKDYDYSPLSTDQKEEMTDSEIEVWEEAAKEGILKSDNILYNLYQDFRNSFLQSIEDADESFFNIGISTTDYSSNGKLEVDETKLRAGLEENLGNVMELFTKSSDIDYTRVLSTDEAETRFEESGLAQRINDIIKNNISTVRNDQGIKGFLIEKAGIVGDASEFNNTIARRIVGLEERYDDTVESIEDQEDAYWSEFSALEQAIQTMNSQSSWLTSQLG